MAIHSFSFDSLPTDPTAIARDALNGLAVGDAFGAQFFVPDNLPALRDQQLPEAPWPWTDDTEMACSIHQLVMLRGKVDQDELARSFAERHDFDRGYGPAMNRLLRLVRKGDAWRELAAGLFDGQGSWGNGAAMRVAPLGARYPGDPEQAARQAALSAEVTHTHPEAIAGAVAVAVAASRAAHGRTQPVTGVDLLTTVLDLTPPGRVRDGIAEAHPLLDQPYVELAAHRLGNGRQVSAVDTVPFTLWCAARHLTDYEAALWATASAGGDVDTTCAIVGGIVASRVGTEGIPTVWRDRAETLPAWLHGHDSWETVHATTIADRHPCPCCGHLVHDEPCGSYEICPVCFWEDDLLQLRRPTTTGANRVSLIEAQRNVQHFGACDQRGLRFTRRPLPDEPLDPLWRPIDPQQDSFKDADDPAPWPDYQPDLYWRRQSE
ncbi:ADP-ribosylglycohydrolase family protein [Streptacidiphilus neutrinimicus]|uniref:ADP-ribosylglycohydrolase family protein n=1 Tax=Streptacidiphilus neutrinimicus TaxID=105420 RepID=UPI0007C86FC2